MDPKVAEALIFVYNYAANIDDWLVIKKELLKALPSDVRTQFSTRDPVTKKQRTNDFERMVAERWSETTGRPVIFT